ncbi:MAG: putative bifunctional diguanylate cyclase/phosphodiesterase [Phycisphaerales bacterium]
MNQQDSQLVESLISERDHALQTLKAERNTIAELTCQKTALDEHAVVSITDTRGIIQYANDKFCQLSGYTKEELIGQTHGILRSGEHSKEFYKDLWRTIASGKTWTGEIKNKAKDGSYYWLNATIVPTTNAEGNITKYVAIRADITEQKETERKIQESNNALSRALEQLETQATTDKLTGLPNRDHLKAQLEKTIANARKDNSKYAVLFFDFDRFKRINDSLGHNVGDALLCSIADIFRSQLDESDIVARFGGDEFVVLFNHLKTWEEANQKAERLRQAFAQPHKLGSHNVVSTASIGMASNQYGTFTPDEIFRDADAAMYYAKEKGRNRVVKFDHQMHIDAIQRLLIEEDLHTAIENDQFHLVYQPLINLSAGKLKGFEALIRWYHPTRGLVSPAEFIPIAEDSELMIDIGNWVLRNSVKQLREWDTKFSDQIPLTMNVNISKRQLTQPKFLESLLALIEEFDIKPNQLILEITETVIVDSRADVIPLLFEVQSKGFPIAMDDFGTGVSSLSTLHAYPIDILKIDQSFIKPLNGDRALLAVVSAITSLAENLGISTVAEGIETEDIVGAIQSIGCTVGQGYHFAKPLSSEDSENFILSSIQSQSQSQKQTQPKPTTRAA